ncbi:MAG: VWA domain-containing protein [Candidatus Methanomethylicus sp.]|nr:VWA domain-containing protein [Candidatus Methanomethylicus sp.]
MTYSLLYLIDCSGSMNKSKGVADSVGSNLNLVKKYLLDLLGNPRAFKPGDRVGILCLNQKKVNLANLNLIMPLEDVSAMITQKRLPSDALGKVTGEGGAPLGAAIKEAVRILALSEVPSKGIVLITDGSESVGEDPLLETSDALLKGVRIDVLGLGVKPEEPILKAIAEKTGGFFKRITSISEISLAIAWERTPMMFTDKSALLVLDRANVKEELKELDGYLARAEIDQGTYESKKQTMEAKIVEIGKTLAEESAKVAKEMEAIKMDRQSIAAQLDSLRASFFNKAMDKKTFLEQANPIESKLSTLNRDIDARQQLIDFLR